MFSVALYFIVMFALLLFWKIDIGPKCVWKALFKKDCIGCGLIHAGVDILKLDFKAAFHHNALIFVVFPAGVYYIIKDFLIFKKQTQHLSK